jgi:hypothetical protein
MATLSVFESIKLLRTLVVAFFLESKGSELVGAVANADISDHYAATISTLVSINDFGMSAGK